VEFVSNVYRENGHTVIQCNIRDITERKALEAALSQAQRRDKEVALAVLRPMLFQPREDAFSGLTVQTAYAMAADEALVGGDFWDTFAYDHGHVALVLGDVIGHGLASAVFTTELKHTMRAYIREHEQPARILYQMNQFLYQSNRLFEEGINTEGSDAPVCVALAVIARETGAGTLALAGMEPPILVRANGQTEQSAAVGTPLGIVPNEEYTQIDFQLEAGDTLILTTDGITEARQGRTFLDAGGLMRLAVAGNGGTLKEMADAILNGAREFAGGKLRDDASLVLVRRTSTSPHIDKKQSDP
jgi:sigma-B regulation protein RsbU (phosphoserine phosphatase)